MAGDLVGHSGPTVDSVARSVPEQFISTPDSECGRLEHNAEIAVAVIDGRIGMWTRRVSAPMYL